MILPVHDRLRAHLTQLLIQTFSLDAASLPAIALEYPPTRELGDLGTPVAFELARRLRKAPRVIAEDIARDFGTVDGIARVSAAPNGYLNVFLERPSFLVQRLTNVLAAARPAAGKAIVEHTAINPNKAAHHGHLRNSALGDTLVRVLKFRGTHVEVQNYIDDTGVQVADVVVGFRVLENMDVEQVRTIADTTRFDYYCWDLYSRMGDWYEEDRERLKIRAQTLHDIERGHTVNAEMAALIADRIVRTHLKTMKRMNVDYDLLTWEGDILRLQFWARAFEVLKEKGAVYLRQDGKLAGCWVMPIQEDLETTAEPDSEAAGDTDEREKVIVRSNGVVTYVGKDIAYQFWKLGLLGRDFHYRKFIDRPQGPLWATCDRDGEAVHPPFGGAAYAYNVIDVRQSYLQKLLKQALIAVGHPEGAEHSHHFSYEMVTLSHATARELGFAPEAGSEDAKRPFVEVSGRKGLGVKADDLIDRLVERASEEVRRRNPDFTSSETARIAQAIGVAALRYFMIKFSRGRMIVFDMDEALSFVGETGPYIQYSVVRANKILLKLKERDGVTDASLVSGLAGVPADELNGGSGQELWALVLEASRLDEIVEQVVRSLEFSVLAKYAFSLAQSFSTYYNLDPSRSSILNEDRPDVRRWRAAAVLYVRDQLTRSLDLMGIEVPARM
jgi:arginyl-tRNA synthetase